MIELHTVDLGPQIGSRGREFHIVDYLFCEYLADLLQPGRVTFNNSKISPNNF